MQTTSWMLRLRASSTIVVTNSLDASCALGVASELILFAKLVRVASHFLLLTCPRHLRRFFRATGYLHRLNDVGIFGEIHEAVWITHVEKISRGVKMP